MGDGFLMRVMSTATFAKLAKASKMQHLAHQEYWILKTIYCSKQRTLPAGLDILKKADELYRKRLVGCTDWVTELAPDAYLLYGCQQCHLYPTSSARWWRCTGYSSDNMTSLGTLEEQTVEGNAKHSWRCGNCGISHHNVNRQCFVIKGDKNEFTYSYIGGLIGDQISGPLQNKLNFLKTLTLLKEIDGMELTKADVVRCVHLINERAANRLLSSTHSKVVVSRFPWDTVAKNDGSGETWPIYNGPDLYCEDQRLSLPGAGIVYNALYLPPAIVGPSQMTAPQIEELLDGLCALTNIDDLVSSDWYYEKREPAQKKVLTDLTQPAKKMRRVTLRRELGDVKRKRMEAETTLSSHGGSERSFAGTFKSEEAPSGHRDSEQWGTTFWKNTGYHSKYARGPPPPYTLKHGCSQ